MKDFVNLDLLDDYLTSSVSEYEDYFDSIVFSETGYKFNELPESEGITISYTEQGEFFVNDIKQAAGTGILFIELIKKEKNIIRIFNCYELMLICYGYIKSSESDGIYSEKETFSKYMSKNGAKGAAIKNEPMKALKAMALKLSREYPVTKSANSIAFSIKETVIQHGKTISAHLTQHNAQDTIKKWINESRNN
ncbi:MAG: hypothetical protein PSV17_03375 [Methylotenera sp.]|uniref:hypothetical protein n=1 Tax=Methylotenera sp. TaxID=2051956 RepID=UPI0024875A48|nr:hypothetical protein [Methylotenera sp.]MDI1308458.1 hypothetical protein [Methylotenera sp.]